MAHQQTSQMVEIYLDGSLQRVEKLDNSITHVRLKIPSWHSKNYTIVMFKLLNPISPKDVNLAEDNRKLGVGLISATLH